MSGPTAAEAARFNTILEAAAWAGLTGAAEDRTAPLGAFFYELGGVPTPQEFAEMPRDYATSVAGGTWVYEPIPPGTEERRDPGSSAPIPPGDEEHRDSGSRAAPSERGEAEGSVAGDAASALGDGGRLRPPAAGYPTPGGRPVHRGGASPPLRSPGRSAS